ncbi:MAG TPA: hypothetical protein VK210_04130 [Terriglobia bacterium]|nr:hypothetical protein [Terriglobia bacterium]
MRSSRSGKPVHISSAVGQFAFNEFINRMTVRQFRRLLKELPFHLVAFQRLCFGGKSCKAARVFRSLAQVPLADKFFLKAVVRVFQKPPI